MLVKTLLILFTAIFFSGCSYKFHETLHFSLLSTRNIELNIPSYEVDCNDTGVFPEISKLFLDYNSCLDPDKTCEVPADKGLDLYLDKHNAVIARIHPNDRDMTGKSRDRRPVYLYKKVESAE